uniref:Uncharacterized protein n=1 Tax=Chromera velia CCMP2878 TaxID=1169474 RepID=A0A0G4HKR3_9ALVE|eukprot:Cvel_7287.t1-p1 / transcript=Cvel_7287.t1 / gene=Cvel_7287 / organism=Chromera_velia_CCMP2878 / gene_product=hypothetical protein / transcript_product=hypothetical protein / location=Cvel_scaffold376:93287-93848(+) / protein_length=78 / sequence_SO=supercontig / SO=protein_coding / is_pseudo=false
MEGHSSPELVVLTIDGVLWCLDSRGELKWRRKLENELIRYRAERAGRGESLPRLIPAYNGNLIFVPKDGQSPVVSLCF